MTELRTLRCDFCGLESREAEEFSYVSLEPLSRRADELLLFRGHACSGCVGRVHRALLSLRKQQ
jgi:hypothetical protein